MHTNDDQQFFNEQLRQATESDDPQAEIGLVLLRYHQAMLRAVQALQPCDVCTAKIDVDQLHTRASEIQRQNYGSYQELQRVVKERLSDTSKLCNECQRSYKASMLRIFAEMHAAH